MERLTLDILQSLLFKSYSKETSFTPDLWTPDNPIIGHVPTTALIVQDFFGGEIKRGEIPEEWQEKTGYHAHYWNVLEHGEEVDLTRQKFPKEFPYNEFIEGRIGEILEKNVRKHLLDELSTQNLYNLLLKKVDVLIKLRYVPVNILH